ncbi:MAG: SPASM domain-containing protein [Flavobacteriales bacterium]|nr:SPASM domain-containing protein [Flavobacteriales bacterium]
MKSHVRTAGSYLIRHTTPRRVANVAKLYASYHRSRLAKRNFHSGMPASVAIEPTTSCNLGCPECPSGLKKFTRPTGMLRDELLTDLLDEIGPTLQHLQFYFQGEPFIHPRITDLFAKAAEYGVYTSTSTNAHFINPSRAEDIVRSGLRQLIISIDGTTQEVYEQYRRRGSLAKVLEGTRHIIEAKKRLNSPWPLVYFQFLVVRPNQHQIDDVLRLGKETGVDEVLFKTAQVYEYEKGNPLIPTLDEYARYEKLPDGTYRIKNKLLNQCWKMWHSCVLTWDGRVVPCCFDKDADHQLGQFGELPFRQIWKGEAYGNFRGAILKSRGEIDICTNCSEGTKVWG